MTHALMKKHRYGEIISQKRGRCKLKVCDCKEFKLANIIPKKILTKEQQIKKVIELCNRRRRYHEKKIDIVFRLDCRINSHCEKCKEKIDEIKNENM